MQGCILPCETRVIKNGIAKFALKSNLLGVVLLNERVRG